MQDYYDPSPRLALSEPLVIGGHVGSGAAQVARAIAARTGLPFHDVDRIVENAAGRSLGRIVAEDGPAALRTLALDGLRRAIARRPCSLVVLGSAAVEAEDLTPLLDEARFVCLRRPPQVLLERIHARLERSPGSLFQFQLARPTCVGELEPMLAAREPALAIMHVTIDAGDRHAHELAGELIQALDRITGVERL